MPDYLCTVTGDDGIQTCYLTLTDLLARFSEQGLTLAIDDLTVTTSNTSRVNVLGTPAFNTGSLTLGTTAYTAGQVLVFKLQSLHPDVGDFLVFLKVEQGTAYIDEQEFPIRKAKRRS